MRVGRGTPRPWLADPIDRMFEDALERTRDDAVRPVSHCEFSLTKRWEPIMSVKSSEIRSSHARRTCRASTVAKAGCTRCGAQVLSHLCPNGVHPYRYSVGCRKPSCIRANPCKFPAVRYARTIGVAMLMGATA